MMTATHQSTRARTTRALALGASLLMVSLLIVTGSRAAFSDTTDNPGNSFAAGDVDLIDDDGDAGSVMFNLSNMAPGDGATRCIKVTYQGSLTPADVKVYGSTAGSGLDAYLDTTIRLGTGGSFASCLGFVPTSTIYSGTLAGFAAAHSDWATGLTAWSPAISPDARTFEVTVTLQDDDGAEALDATANFTWEVQNS